MSYDVANFSEYNIVNENQVAMLLSRFDQNIFYDIIKDIINKRSYSYNFNIITNIPASYENYFKQCELNYPSEKETIDSTRYDTYLNIINILCTSHNLQFNSMATQDLYSAAYYLYDFLISNFNSHIINFFTNFIIKEKNFLYDSLGLSQLKKNKDSSTLYNKKIYKNNKLAVIASNLEYVIDNICVFDIPLEALLNYIFQDKNNVRFLSQLIAPITDFFKSVYVPLIQSQIRPILMSNIRLEIQKNMGDELDISDIQ